MKYIIDVPSDLYAICKTLRVSVKVGNGDLSWYNTYIKAEPYTEPDRKAIENVVWEFAMKCLSMDGSEFCDVFDSCDALCLTNYSYQDAKAKYEAWKAEREQIRVGDEVVEKDRKWEGVVVNIDDCGELTIMDRNGASCGGYKLKHFKKTGRHFPEVAELMKKMRGSDD